MLNAFIKFCMSKKNFFFSLNFIHYCEHWENVRSWLLYFHWLQMAQLSHIPFAVDLQISRPEHNHLLSSAFHTHMAHEYSEPILDRKKNKKKFLTQNEVDTILCSLRKPYRFEFQTLIVRSVGWVFTVGIKSDASIIITPELYLWVHTHYAKKLNKQKGNFS